MTEVTSESARLSQMLALSVADFTFLLMTLR